MEPTTAAEDRTSSGIGRRTGAFVIAYALAAVLILTLLHTGGVWNVLANTRLLDLLVRSGVVALTDADAGWVLGVPDLEQYRASQDPVDWGMLALAGGVFCVYWTVKSWQFHLLARFTGVPGEVGEHARAFLYGLGVSRMLPFDIGEVATADALEAAGARPRRAARAVFLAHLTIVFEIVVFGALALVLLGLATWFQALLWGVVVLGVAWFLVRPRRGGPAGYLTSARRSVRALAAHPRTAVPVALLSLVAFVLEDIAAYVITQAFTSEHVILNVDHKVLVIALVAGYLARLINATPGGLGQFEWAFAAALYACGVGFPEAVTIAVLDNLVRYVTGTGVLVAMTVRYRSGTNLRRVLQRASEDPESSELVDGGR